ncbi:MAG: patatin-like phospholipase family protein [Bacteroidota bacterium]
MKLPFVLSGGGVRGFAHLGVLKAFSERDIYPAVITSTSAGSIIGAMICDGYGVEEIMDLAIKNKLYGFEWTFPMVGLMSLKPLKDFLTKYLRHKNLEDLPTPLYVTATNLLDGRQEIFSKGDVVQAVIASCSIPMIFPPVTINNVPYIDGGFSSNLPIEPLLGGYEDIVGVHVNPLPDYNPLASITEHIERLGILSIRENVMRNMSRCTIFIEPPALAKYRLFDEKKKQLIYDEGYNYTKQYLDTKHQ